MATKLTGEQMKEFVTQHFEGFVNKRNASVIRKNMTPDFYDQMDAAESLPAWMQTSR
jgi:hypothetical protein